MNAFFVAQSFRLCALRRKLKVCGTRTGHWLLVITMFVAFLRILLQNDADASFLM